MPLGPGHRFVEIRKPEPFSHALLAAWLCKVDSFESAQKEARSLRDDHMCKLAAVGGKLHVILHASASKATSS